MHLLVDSSCLSIAHPTALWRPAGPLPILLTDADEIPHEPESPAAEVFGDRAHPGARKFHEAVPGNRRTAAVDHRSCVSSCGGIRTRVRSRVSSCARVRSCVRSRVSSCVCTSFRTRLCISFGSVIPRSGIVTVVCRHGQHRRNKEKKDSTSHFACLYFSKQLSKPLVPNCMQ